ncbi:two component transcriptional regulator, winged helix family protein [Plesiocystis pacifica SIR-1]|uniref:Two component transcriptional regulator, winged helix family protein n=1 Tax=Plesiocystis pacifica SIR-1 TaxID=391625 RepID=A6GGY5_9BACT|nr:response regulator transcription factor [Plesiocystis pacifica]EDM74870.1 two component transcriptional regulator, winged helix family protein [Plesiocystis pacifica SIR-1]
MNPERILIAEDDVRLAQLMREAFVRRGYEALLLHGGGEVVPAVWRLRPDLLVLDLMLPGADGFEILRHLRPRWTGPILILTARDGDFDQVSGLELGADDYIAKPVATPVLLARVRALLRRSRSGPREAELELGELRITPSAREVRAQGRLLSLSDSEYELLVFLAARAGEVVTREQLFRELRGIEYDGLDRSMDLRVSKLRARLREQLEGRAPIRTVHGRGYLFAVERPPR